MKRIGQVLQEIHRRSLWQVLGSYAVGAWIVLQLAEVLSSLIGLPLWLGPVLVTLLAVGLALLLLTALIQGGIRSRSTAGRGSGGWLSRTFTWRNALVGALAVVALLTVGTGTYMGLRAAGIGPAGTLVAKGVLDEAEPVILAEFENRTQDPTLAETVTALLRIDLSQSPTITLLEPVQLAPVLTRMQRDPGTPLTFDVAREVAQREGLKAIVAGEVLPLGESFVLSARVVSVATGESLAAARETADEVGRIPEAIDGLSASLRERIGESLRTIQAEPALAQVTTSSIDALRDFAQADAANDAGEIDRALALLQGAVDKDSTFAMAHRKLAIILANQGRQMDRARASFTRAYEIRDRLTERERFLAEAAYHSYVSLEEPAAMAAYEALLATYPNDRVAMNNLAVAYERQGRLAEAERLYGRSIDLGGAPAVTYTNAIETRFRLGWADSARATLRAFAEAYATNTSADLYGSMLASASFDYARADSAIQLFRERSTGAVALQVQAEAERANILFAQGRMASGLDAYRTATRMQERLGGGQGFVPWAVAEPVVRAYAQVWYFTDPDGAVRILDGIPEARIAELEPGQRDYVRRAGVYATAGESEKARTLLAAWQAEIPAADRANDDARIGAELTRGAIAQAEGRADDAIDIYRSARLSSPACALCGLIELATVHDETGQADSAIAFYERYLSTPMLERSNFDNTNLWRALLRLGALYETRGDTGQAVAYYTRFLDLWENADPDLQPRVREVRDRVARLTAPRG